MRRANRGVHSGPHSGPHPGEHSGEHPGEHSGRPPRGRWHWWVAVAFAAAGVLFVTSALDARGQDLRAASVTDLASLVREQRRDTDQRQGQVAALNREVSSLSAAVEDTGLTGQELRKLRSVIREQRGPAGTTAVEGSGLVVTLDDAPEDVQDDAVRRRDPRASQLVVHQQDLQAVVNALWLGGARAVSLMDQRIVSTTGIKCVGPTVLLQGLPYSPPYVIKAVGVPSSLLAALDDSDFVSAYREVVEDYGLGYDAETSDDVRVPAYEGPLTLRYAEPLVG